MGQARRRGSRDDRIRQAKARKSSATSRQAPAASADPVFGSTAIKSTRRILFNHLDQSIAERGHWHVDQMYGSGTGILLKQDRAFYLLTADHVIRNACNYQFKNESPFWVTARSAGWPSDMLGFLMPGQILHIGEMMTEQGIYFDAADLVLVELFHPAPAFLPDHYIDLDAWPGALMAQEDFKAGIPLVAAGYPFHANEFEYFDEARADNMTHGTNVNRWVVDGLCAIQENEPSITRPGGEFPALSGASGGIVAEFPLTAAPARMAGMLLSATAMAIRFIPSYLIAKALAHKHACRRTLVDPVFRGQPHPQMLAFMEELASGRLFEPGSAK